MNHVLNVKVEVEKVSPDIHNYQEIAIEDETWEKYGIKTGQTEDRRAV